MSQTPLFYAVSAGHTETVRFILAATKYKRMDTRDASSRTPLSAAISTGNSTLVEMLLDHGADVNEQNEQGESALIIAARAKNVKSMQILLERGAGINHADKNGITALLSSQRLGCWSAVKLLLDRGADVNIADSFGATPLLEASREHNADLVKVLLDKGAQVDPPSQYSSPLHSALTFWLDSTCETKGGKTVRLLLEAGADPNVNLIGNTYMLNRPNTPFIMAAHNTPRTVVELMLDHGAETNHQALREWSPLFSAVQKNSADVVKLLLNRGCNPHGRDDLRRTPIFWAVSREDREVVEHLISHGGDINARDQYLTTPLMVAARDGILSMVQFILSQGSNMADEDIIGDTALFYAAKGGCDEVVSLLLENGANLHHKNALMETPLFLAARLGSSTVTDLLLTHGAEANLHNIFHETPLLYAAGEAQSWAEQRFATTIERLVERGADVDPVPYKTDMVGLFDLLLKLNPKGLRVLESEVDPEANHIIKKHWNHRTRSFTDQQLAAFMGQLACSANLNGILREWQVGKATPLMWAVDRRCKKLASMFLGLGARVDIKDTSDRTALMIAVGGGDPDMISLFLTPELENQLVDVDFEQLIQCAAMNSHSAAIQLLLSKATIEPTAGSSALLFSAAMANAEAVQLLLDKGYKADLQDEDGMTPFHYAAFQRSQAIVKSLIEANASSFDAKDNHGRTPLFWAVQRNHLSVAKALLQAGADPNTVEDGGSSPILFDDLNDDVIFGWRTTRSRTERDLASERDALMARTEPGGQTPLFFAAGNGKYSLIKLLLDHGADPNIQDRYGETALCWAARRRCEMTVRLLLDRGAIPGAVGDSIQAPILWAVGSQGGFISYRVYRGNQLRWNNSPSEPEVIVNILIKHGADPNFHGPGVEPILFAALANGNNSLLQHLLDAGCDPNLQSEDGETPLYRAAALGLEDRIQLLCAHGANSNLANRFGRTPLMVATVRGHWKCVLVLLSVKTIQKDASDILGRSASSEAQVRGTPPVKKVLLDGHTNSKDLEALEVEQSVSKLEQDHLSETSEGTSEEACKRVCEICDALDIDDDDLTDLCLPCDIGVNYIQSFCQECYKTSQIFKQQELSDPLVIQESRTGFQNTRIHP
jgi:ankyrin repeat protein